MLGTESKAVCHRLLENTLNKGIGFEVSLPKENVFWMFDKENNHQERTTIVDI